MKIAPRQIVLYGLLLFWAGCAQTVAVTVSGTNKTGEPIPPRVTYVVLPTAEIEKDRAFPEYVKLVASEMDARHYKQTTQKAAQLGVFLDYATNDGTAGNVATTGTPGTGISSGVGAGSSGTGGFGGGGYGVPVGPPSGSTGLTTSTSQMVIVVVDLQKSRATGKPVELWRGETIYTGSSNDLAQLAPLMVDAAFRHFGDTTPDMARHIYNGRR
ncbi:MAG: DUF4136 domain-containing protein [Nitrospira sp.]|nr:DUF4136 domain-containing protein [Nitrospira sp.]